MSHQTYCTTVFPIYGSFILTEHNEYKKSLTILMSLIPDDGCKESIGNVGNSFHTDMTLAVHLRRLHCKPILLNCNYLLDQEISCCYAA
jgi:hypothetical protein